MTIFLRTDTEAEMIENLVEAEILTALHDESDGFQPTQGYSVDTLGRIFKPTGEVVIVDAGGDSMKRPGMSVIPGWHVNILGPLSDAQRAVLPILDPPPATPERVFA